MVGMHRYVLNNTMSWRLYPEFVETILTKALAFFSEVFLYTLSQIEFIPKSHGDNHCRWNYYDFCQLMKLQYWEIFSFNTCISFLGLLLQSTTNFGWLKQQKCIHSEFWRLEVWSQGVAGLCALEALGEGASCFFQLLVAPGVLGLWLHHPSLCSHLFPVFFCLSSYKDTSH